MYDQTKIKHFHRPPINYYVQDVDKMARFYKEHFGFIETFCIPEEGLALQAVQGRFQAAKEIERHYASSDFYASTLDLFMKVTIMNKSSWRFNW